MSEISPTNPNIVAIYPDAATLLALHGSRIPQPPHQATSLIAAGLVKLLAPATTGVVLVQTRTPDGDVLPVVSAFVGEVETGKWTVAQLGCGYIFGQEGDGTSVEYSNLTQAALRLVRGESTDDVVSSI